jgi:hypothetical protein
MRMRGLRTTRCRNQATAELVISFVGLMALFLGLTQIALVGHRSIANGQESRAKAEEAMYNAGIPVSEAVQDWKDGEDGLSYTADDEKTTGGGKTSEFQEAVSQPVWLSLLEGYGATGQGTAVSPLFSAGSTATAADLKEGKATDSVPLDPAMHYLLTGASQLSLTDKTYMPGISLRDLVPVVTPSQP